MVAPGFKPDLGPASISTFFPDPLFFKIFATREKAEIRFLTGQKNKWIRNGIREVFFGGEEVFYFSRLTNFSEKSGFPLFTRLFFSDMAMPLPIKKLLGAYREVRCIRSCRGLLPVFPGVRCHAADVMSKAVFLYQQDGRP